VAIYNDKTLRRKDPKPTDGRRKKGRPTVFLFERPPNKKKRANQICRSQKNIFHSIDGRRKEAKKTRIQFQTTLDQSITKKKDKGNEKKRTLSRNGKAEEGPHHKLIGANLKNKKKNPQGRRRPILTKNPLE